MLNDNICFLQCTEGHFISVNIVKKFMKYYQIITDYCVMHKKQLVLSLLATSSIKSMIVKGN